MAADHLEIPAFARRFYGTPERFTRIGDGAVGGKAAGLLVMRDVLAALAAPPRIDITIPRLTVLAVDLFERFMAQNALHGIALSDAADDRIALAFQQADLPPDILGDLRALVEQVRTPLAVRSSSLLEDALREPFAGVYATKMIPNNQPDADTRFRRLVEAIKFVYSSTFFADARVYRRATGRADGDEQMAVIIQEVMGRRHDARFYPDVSGVARSFSFYRAARAKPEDGVATLALGLGRSIVDDGVGWSYSPAWPAAPPPVSSIDELAATTQRRFWAVNMGPPPPYDPIRETEYLVHADLDAAEFDGTLRYVASTYDAARDRLLPGAGVRGARILNFAPLLVLREWAVNDLVRALLAACERAAGDPVEIEFAITLARDGIARLGFLQVRPMVLTTGQVDVAEADLSHPEAVIASSLVMGNGVVGDLHDVVYVRPEQFDPRHTRQIAGELARLNLSLAADRVPYLLIGFGRWGSSDPWLGIPVTWPQVSGARVIVEAALPSFSVELSQGSHFFHNIASQGVSYFSVPAGGGIDWKWLSEQPAAHDSPLVRHVRSAIPLVARIDGRTGRGVVLRDPSARRDARDQPSGRS